MIYTKLAVLITIEQLWFRYPDVMALYTDDTALIIIDEECTIAVSLILSKAVAPRIILTIVQFRLYPLRGSVCKIIVIHCTL